MATDCFPPLEQPPEVAPSITDPAACKLFREWEANTLAPWLVDSAPKICDALNLSNSVIDMTNFKGTHVFGTTYNLGESVVLDDKFYVSLQDGNVSVPPSAGWQRSGTTTLQDDVTEIKKHINKPIVSVGIGASSTPDSGTTRIFSHTHLEAGTYLILFGVTPKNTSENYSALYHSSIGNILAYGNTSGAIYNGNSIIRTAQREAGYTEYIDAVGLAGINDVYSGFATIIRIGD